MHGDAEARSNDRPPWHVLHPGRAWAMNEKLANSRELDRIEKDIAEHFEKYAAFKSHEQVVEQFLHAFAQDPMAAAEPVADDEVTPDEMTNEDDATA